MDNVNPFKQPCLTCKYYEDFGRQMDGHCNNLDSWVRADWTGCIRWESKEADIENATATQ